MADGATPQESGPPRPRGWSLRGRLLALLLAAAFAAWVASALWLVQRAQQATERLFDSALAETAHLVLALAVRDDGEHDRRDRRRRGRVDDDLAELLPTRGTHDERTFFQVRDGRGRIALVSPGAPTAPLADRDARGYAERAVDGRPWRVFTLHDEASGITVHVGDPLAARVRFAREALWQLAAPGLALLLALAVITLAVTQRLLRPVEHAAQRIAAAAPGATLALDRAALPREIEPLLKAIDALQARVQQALLHERTLTADAAHELRTPLAALRAQAQLAQAAQRAGDAAGRDAALGAVIEAADRCARLAESTLTLARLDATTLQADRLPAVDLARIAQLVQRDLAAAAAARGIDVGLDIARDLDLHADEDALAILLRNLLDNAIRHARARVRVQAEARAGGVELAVRDDGDGVAQADRARLFDRFWRAEGGNGESGGSGLGLAMVRRIAQLHGAQIATGDGLEGRGLGIVVRFAAPPG
jgi:signal transduction histidine kinase